jgi:hypothetical protein
LYHDEVTARNEFLPRFIAEPVMAQLESEANMAKLSPSFRHLVVVITETGLRAGNACALAFESMVAGIHLSDGDLNLKITAAGHHRGSD